jgi:hypothetical protein
MQDAPQLKKSFKNSKVYQKEQVFFYPELQKPLAKSIIELESIGEGEYALTKKQKVSIFTKGLVAEEYAMTKHSIY